MNELTYEEGSLQEEIRKDIEKSKEHLRKMNKELKKEDLTCIREDYCNCGGIIGEDWTHEKWCNHLKHKNLSNVFNQGIEQGRKEAIKIIEDEPIYPYYQGLSIEEALTRFKIKIQNKLKGEKNDN